MIILGVTLREIAKTNYEIIKMSYCKVFLTKGGESRKEIENNIKYIEDL